MLVPLVPAAVDDFGARRVEAETLEIRVWEARCFALLGEGGGRLEVVGGSVVFGCSVLLVLR